MVCIKYVQIFCVYLLYLNKAVKIPGHWKRDPKCIVSKNTALCQLLLLNKCNTFLLFLCIWCCAAPVKIQHWAEDFNCNSQESKRLGEGYNILVAGYPSLLFWLSIWVWRIFFCRDFRYFYGMQNTVRNHSLPY